MIKNSVTAQDVCNILNEMLKLDYACTKNLVSHREKCNDKVANHPTIQVQQFKEDTFPKVGIIGIINGIFGIREDGMGAICYEFDDDAPDKIIRFKPTPKKTV